MASGCMRKHAILLYFMRYGGFCLRVCGVKPCQGPAWHAPTRQIHHRQASAIAPQQPLESQVFQEESAMHTRHFPPLPAMPETRHALPHPAHSSPRQAGTPVPLPRRRPTPDPTDAPPLPAGAAFAPSGHRPGRDRIGPEPGRSRRRNDGYHPARSAMRDRLHPPRASAAAYQTHRRGSRRTSYRHPYRRQPKPVHRDGHSPEAERTAATAPLSGTGENPRVDEPGQPTRERHSP